MTQRRGSIHEVTYRIDPDSVEEFDAWLQDHTDAVSSWPGVTDCRVFSATGDAEGRTLRVCHQQFSNDDALNDFQRSLSAESQADLAERFADRVTSRTRVFREDEIPGTGSTIPNCMNCGARLRGQYCGSCGQRSRSRLISIWELLRDAFGDLFEADSRLWKTLIPLLIRPGALTLDYLHGRRARYMPPFRTYLVLSLVFFVVAFFDPHQEFGLLFEPGSAPASPSEQTDGERTRNEIARELAEQAVIAQSEPSAATGEQRDGISFSIGSHVNSEMQCDIESFDVDDLPGWLARRLTPERLQHICERTRTDDGRAIADKLLETIPAALIVLLPIMALVLKLLYPLSHRYYVEHLLFFVHFHAFFFFILTLQVLFTRLSATFSVPGVITTSVITATSLYVPVYLFVGMRRVYGQGRLITWLKYCVLVSAYLAGLMATMLGALAIAVFSI